MYECFSKFKFVEDKKTEDTKKGMHIDWSQVVDLKGAKNVVCNLWVNDIHSQLYDVIHMKVSLGERNLPQDFFRNGVKMRWAGKIIDMSMV